MTTVSICIPAYNSARYIGATIDSVLAQTFADFELIVVDDCSTDDTAEVARSYRDTRVRFVANDRNLGAMANWNKAVSLAAGRYLKLLCGDDVLYPRCLERQVEGLEDHGHRGAVMASGRRDIIDEGDRVLVRSHGLPGLRGMVPGDVAIRAAVRSGANPFGEPAAVLVLTRVVRACGPFAGHLPYVADLEMWFRVLGHGQLVAQHDALCGFRVSRSSLSYRLAGEQGAQSRALFHATRRRRPELISPADEVIGAVRSRVIGYERRLVYLAVAGLARLGPRRDSTSPPGIPRRHGRRSDRRLGLLGGDDEGIREEGSPQIADPMSDLTEEL